MYVQNLKGFNHLTKLLLCITCKTSKLFEAVPIKLEAIKLTNQEDELFFSHSVTLNGKTR